jgi:hypothetical protein
LHVHRLVLATLPERQHVIDVKLLKLAGKQTPPVRAGTRAINMPARQSFPAAPSLILSLLYSIIIITIVVVVVV